MGNVCFIGCLDCKQCVSCPEFALEGGAVDGLQYGECGVGMLFDDRLRPVEVDLFGSMGASRKNKKRQSCDDEVK